MPCTAPSTTRHATRWLRRGYVLCLLTCLLPSCLSSPTQDVPRKLPKGSKQVRLPEAQSPASESLSPRPGQTEAGLWEAAPSVLAQDWGPAGSPETCPLSSLLPGEAQEVGGVLVLHPAQVLPPSSSLALGLRQEPRLSLGGQHCAGEPDEELAGAFPLFIRNAVLGQKPAKRARAEPGRSTDAVSVPPVGAGPAHGPPTACRSSLPFTSGQNRLRRPRGPDQVHPACILVLWPWLS